MPRQHVRHLVADDRGELVLIGGHAQQAGVDADLAARQRESVGRIVPEQGDLPSLLAAAECAGHGPRHTAHVGVGRGIPLARFLFLDVGVSREPHLRQVRIRKQLQLAAAER